MTSRAGQREERRSEKRKSQRKEDGDVRKGRNVANHCVFLMICGLCGTTGINQDSGAWVLIFEGFWVLKFVFEWCRIHIKTVFAQHSPRKSGNPTKSQKITPRFSQEIPETPTKSLEISNFPGEPGELGRT